MIMTSIAQKNRFTLVAFAFSLIAIVTAQRIDVEPSKLTALENQEAIVMCRSGKPLVYCRFEVPGEPTGLHLSQAWDNVPGFQYQGTGLNDGQCGVVIKHVKLQNHGIVRCMLGTNDGQELIGQVPLTVAITPRRPELQIVKGNRQGTFEINQEIELKCIARDGRPAAQLSWYIDGEQLHEGFSKPEELETRTNNNQTVYTAVQTLRRYITAGDDHRTLTCRATHANQAQDTQLQFHVKYQPQPQPQIRVFGVVQGLTALINVSIHANPRPRTEWTVDGLVIAEGQQLERYAAYEPQDQGNGVYNVTLAIDALTLEDTTKEYVLRASNEFGQQTYSVRISSSEAAAASGLDIGSIVGIAIGAALLVLIVALVVVARLTGKWCFAGASLNTDIGPDSEAQIAPQHDDYDHEQDQHDGDADQPHHAPHLSTNDEPATAKHGNGASTNGNGSNKHAEKTNTPV